MSDIAKHTTNAVIETGPTVQTFSNEAEPTIFVIVCETWLSLHLHEFALSEVSLILCGVGNVRAMYTIRKWVYRDGGGGHQRNEQVVVSSVGSGRVPFALTTFSQSGSRRPFERLSL